jgi:hypothetical protein
LLQIWCSPTLLHVKGDGMGSPLQIFVTRRPTIDMVGIQMRLDADGRGCPVEVILSHRSALLIGCVDVSGRSTVSTVWEAGPLVMVTDHGLQ